MACQERDVTQQWVVSLKAELKREKAQKVDAENASAELMVGLGREKAKVLTLDKELDEARQRLVNMVCCVPPSGSSVSTLKWRRQRGPAC
jgi:hypothetical protein